MYKLAKTLELMKKKYSECFEVLGIEGIEKRVSSLDDLVPLYCFCGVLDTETVMKEIPEKDLDFILSILQKEYKTSGLQLDAIVRAAKKLDKHEFRFVLRSENT